METCSERNRWVINWSKPVDREALLELADEMDVDAGCNAYVDDYNVYEYARRIREACGEGVRNG